VHVLLESKCIDRPPDCKARRTYTSKLLTITPSLRTSSLKGWPGGALHAGFTYGTPDEAGSSDIILLDASTAVTAPLPSPPTSEELLVLAAQTT